MKGSYNEEKVQLLEHIIEGIKQIKGKGIINIDLSRSNNIICQNFIICHGESNTQVGAIAESIERQVKENLKLKVGHREGMENCQWVLLDYYEVIVHIFQEEFRDFYKLEELWGDAPIERIDSDE